MFDIYDRIEEVNKKNSDGTLTISEIFHAGFYRLLDGEHAGKIIIYNFARIDDKPILTFANSMTWIEKERLKDDRCEMVYPTFNSPKNPIDRSKAHWYSDGGSYCQYEW